MTSLFFLLLLLYVSFANFCFRAGHQMTRAVSPTLQSNCPPSTASRIMTSTMSLSVLASFCHPFSLRLPLAAHPPFPPCSGWESDVPESNRSPRGVGNHITRNKSPEAQMRIGCVGCRMTLLSTVCGREARLRRCLQSPAVLILASDGRTSSTPPLRRQRTLTRTGRQSHSHQFLSTVPRCRRSLIKLSSTSSTTGTRHHLSSRLSPPPHTPKKPPSHSHRSRVTRAPMSSTWTHVA